MCMGASAHLSDTFAVLFCCSCYYNSVCVCVLSASQLVCQKLLHCLHVQFKFKAVFNNKVVFCCMFVRDDDNSDRSTAPPSFIYKQNVLSAVFCSCCFALPLCSPLSTQLNIGIRRMGWMNDDQWWQNNFCCSSCTYVRMQQQRSQNPESCCIQYLLGHRLTATFA